MSDVNGAGSVRRKDPKLVVALATTWALYLGLILAYSLWQVTRPGGPVYFFWVVQLLPLLLVLPGIKSNNPRSYIWLCFVLLLYFIKGVDGVISPSRAWIDYFVLTVSVVLFISSMFTSRWLQHHYYAKAD